MKTLFNFLALCLGFLMVVGTIGLVSVGTAMFLGVRPNDEALIIVVLAITVGFLLFARIARGFMERLTPQVPASEPNDTMAKDETRIMQEIYQGLKRMDERVESLETILIERSRERV